MTAYHRTLASDLPGDALDVRHRQSEIAVIVPVYQGKAMLEELCRRLVATVSTLTQEFSIILVDDASPDKPWSLMQALGKQDTRIKAIRLCRNFGQHSALTAGIDYAYARWYVIMDCDLQDAPEDIAALYKKAVEGHHVVTAYRAKEGHDWGKRAMAFLFYKLFQTLSGVHLDPNVGNFRVFSHAVAEGFRGIRERARFVPASFEWMGFEQVFVEVPHHNRAEGKSSYSLRKLLALAIDTVLAHSQVPLKFVVGAGIAMSLFSFVAAIVVFGRALFFGYDVDGWASLFVASMFLGSVQIALLGIVGIYVGRTFEETKRRPLYIVGEKLNID